MRVWYPQRLISADKLRTTIICHRAVAASFREALQTEEPIERLEIERLE